MTHYITPHDDDLRQTFEKTAEHLSGKSVILRFSDPRAYGAYGECYKSDDGITRINIAPGLTVQEAYNVALEEIAHARLNHSPEPMTAEQYALTANLDARKVNASAERKPIENAAAQLADRWQEKAHEAIKHLIRWNTTDLQRAVMNMAALQIIQP